MKIETIGGAFVAALILFGTGFLAVFQQDGVATIANISQATWLTLGVGAALSFLKDYQALSVRRAMEVHVTKSGNLHSPPAAGLLAGLVALLMLSGCTGLGITSRPSIDSLPDAIAVTAADVETAAQTVKRLCRNTEPGGPCAASAAISTEQKESLKYGLQDVLDGLSLANLAVANDNEAAARGSLARVNALLAVLSAELVRLQN